MPDIAWIIAVVGLIALLFLVVRKGQRLKSVVLGPMSVELDSVASEAPPSVIDFDIPDGVVYLNISLDIGGRHTADFRFSETAGEKVQRELTFPVGGSTYYEMSVTGTRRSRDAHGKTFLTDFHATGSGRINLVHGQRYVVNEVVDLGAGGGVFQYKLIGARDAAMPPDDVQQEAAQRFFDENS